MALAIRTLSKPVFFLGRLMTITRPGVVYQWVSQSAKNLRFVPDGQMYKGRGQESSLTTTGSSHLCDTGRGIPRGNQILCWSSWWGIPLQDSPAPPPHELQGHQSSPQSNQGRLGRPQAAQTTEREKVNWKEGEHFLLPKVRGIKIRTEERVKWNQFLKCTKHLRRQFLATNTQVCRSGHTPMAGIMPCAHSSAGKWKNREIRTQPVSGCYTGSSTQVTQQADIFNSWENIWLLFFKE